MDFSLSEEQQLLVDTLSRFVEKDYGPDTRRQLAESGQGYSEDNWRLFADMGLLGLTVPEEFGGIAGTAADVMLVMEQFGRGLVLEPYLATAVIGAGLIVDAGSEVQKQQYLPSLVAGELKTALAALEPAGRFDLWHVETTARRDGSSYVISGRKCVVAGGACAGLIIVSARTDGHPDDPGGISLFLVDAAAEGLSTSDFPAIDGTRTAEISLENVTVPADALLGVEGEGFPELEKAVDRGIAGLCAEAVGSMDKLAAITADYLCTRQQFGSPLGSFQALQHRFAEVLIAVEQARAMAYCASANVDGEDRTARRLAISAAKAIIGQTGRFVAQQAIQLHGGIGMTDEYVAGHFAKRLNCIDMSWGNEDHHIELYSQLMRFPPQEP